MLGHLKLQIQLVMCNLSTSINSFPIIVVNIHLAYFRKVSHYITCGEEISYNLHPVDHNSIHQTNYTRIKYRERQR